jgi:hypothetical protein
MQISIKQEASTYLPLWYYTTKPHKSISIWEWKPQHEIESGMLGFDTSDEERQTAEEAHDEWERTHEPDGEGV